MALTDQERERIREEEWVRLQAREDFARIKSRTSWARPRTAAFAGVLTVAVALLFLIIRTS